MSHNETAEGHKQGTFAEFEAHVATMGRDELEARAIAFWQITWELDRAGVMAEDPGVVEARIVQLRAERDYHHETVRQLRAVVGGWATASYGSEAKDVLRVRDLYAKDGAVAS